MRLKEVKKKVHYMLSQYPELRDSDARLIANCWAREMNVENMSGLDVIKKIASGDLTPAESIRRARQLIMASDPSLRGKSYKARQKKAVKVKEEIHKF